MGGGEEEMEIHAHMRVATDCYSILCTVSKHETQLIN